MNILYLCADRGIPVRGHKGAAVHVRAMADAFSQAGHAVTILTPRPGPADGPAPQAEIVEVPMPPEAAGDEAGRAAQTWAYAGILADGASAMIAGEGSEPSPRFDFIYERYSLWSDAGAQLVAATGLPLVLEVNAPLIEEASRYRGLGDAALAAEIQRRQLAAATGVAVVSDALRAYVVAHGARPERVHVLPNGVDPQHFHPAVRGGSVRGAYGLDGRVVLGFVGRPRPWHDLETLLVAAALLRRDDPRIHLLLVGEMPDDLPARLACHGLSEATTLTGPVPHDDVPRHIAAMDVAVSTHLPADPTEFYFSPLKLFEYLACGVPVVAADIGQPSQILRAGETGYLYPPGDPAALAGCIRTLLSDPAHARAIAWQGAIAVLAEYTWERNARRVCALVGSGEWGVGNGEWEVGGGEWEVGSMSPLAPSLGPVPSGGCALSDRALRPASQLPILDPKLRQRLYRATRADLAGPFLEELLQQSAVASRRQPLVVERIDVLKHKPGRRCVLGYDLAQPGAGAEPLRVVGKVFRDERGQRLHGLQTGLWAGGFGPAAADGIHVPRSLGYVPEMRMHVQQRSPGRTLNDLAQHGSIAPFVPRCAATLAKLHGTAADPALATYQLADELASLERFNAELVTRLPEQASRIRGLHARLAGWAAALPPAPQLTPVHRDFYYSQVLIDGPRLTLIDFDLLALGDPAIDVANFAAHLLFLGLDKLGDLNALAREAQSFVDAYRCRAPVDASFDQRRTFYQAATLFRLMNVVTARPGLAQHFETLAQVTEQCL